MSKIKIDGVWRTVSSPYVKVSGVWKKAESAWAKVNGFWKNWYLEKGLLDTAFSQNLGQVFSTNDDGAEAVAVQSDGKIILGGFFVSQTIPQRAYSLRLNPDGTLDPTFANDGLLYTIKIYVLPDDSLLFLRRVFGGANTLVKRGPNNERNNAFTTNLGTGFSGGSSFAGSDPYLEDIKEVSPGNFIIVGSFTSFNGQTAGGVIKISETGIADTTFLSNAGTAANGHVSSVAIQPDGKIVLGGFFTTFNGVSANRIVRLNSDGTVDAEFSNVIGSGFNNSVRSVAIQSNGKIIVCGGFSTFQGITNQRMVRLNVDGSLDPSFVTPLVFNVSAREIIILEDDKILYCGSKAPGGALDAGVGLLDKDGARIQEFFDNVNTGIAWRGTPVAYSMALHPEENAVLVSGRINAFNSVVSRNVVRIGLG
jgi:uncharacterized delta-60 repeat protein